MRLKSMHRIIMTAQYRANTYLRSHEAFQVQLIVTMSQHSWERKRKTWEKDDLFDLDDIF